MRKMLIPGLLAACLLAIMSGGSRASDDEAGGDAGKGASIYKAKCGFCHATKADAHKMGPSMAGIYGMKAGSTGYERYLGLKDADFTWDDESLDGFLKNPKKFLGRGTTMAVTLRGAEDRRHVIAYLKTLK